MSESTTSDAEALADELGDRLQAVFDTADKGELRRIGVALTERLYGTEPEGYDRILDRLVELGRGELDILHRIQRMIVDNASRSPATNAIDQLLLELTRAFSAWSPDEIESDDIEFAVDDAVFQRFLDTIPAPVFVKDEQHNWVFLNRACCEFMGYRRQELLGKSDFDFFPDDEAEVFWEKDDIVFSTGEPDENEENFTDADGNEHVIVTHKAMFIDSEGRKFLVGVIDDITKQKRLEHKLDHAKQLMSLGSLASGISHEINNPLSYVLTNLDYALEAMDDPGEPDAEIRAALDATVRGARRVREIVEGLRTFSGDADEQSPVVDVVDALKSTVKVAGNEIRHCAQLRENYRDVPPIEGNRRSLNQVFLNLLINATEALETGGADGHEIRIETRRSPDGGVVVEIADTGPGIAEEIRDRIFEPFFSTKPVGRGTGLGLSICQSLVEAMNGRIEVESTPGKGTTFRLEFPPADGESGDGDSHSEADSLASTAARGNIRILLVDDDPQVLEALERRLGRVFDVDTAFASEEALELLDNGEDYDLIVSDVMMPRMDGRDLYEALCNQHPGAVQRLVFISSGVFDPQLREFIDDRQTPLLEKPPSIEELVEILEA